MASSKNEKNFALFGIARSGTSPYYHLLAEYFWQHNNMKALGEYFASKPNCYRDTGRRIVVWKQSGGQARTKESWKRLVRQKIRWLEKYEGEYFIKILTHHLPMEHMDWLCENLDFVFVERRDIFQHFLSFSTSLLINKWYPPEGIEVRPKSLTFQNRLMEEFEFNYLRYLKFKELCKPRNILYCEDFSENWPSLIKGIGLIKRTNYSKVKLDPKPNLGDKLSYFENPKSIIRRYKDSFLHDLAPIEL